MIFLPWETLKFIRRPWKKWHAQTVLFQLNFWSWIFQKHLWNIEIKNATDGHPLASRFKGECSAKHGFLTTEEGYKQKVQGKCLAYVSKNMSDCIRLWSTEISQPRIHIASGWCFKQATIFPAWPRIWQASRKVQHILGFYQLPTSTELEGYKTKQLLGCTQCMQCMHF